MTTPDTLPPGAIAVIGMAGRYPGARNLDAYWRLLDQSCDAGMVIDEATLRESGVPEAVLADARYVRRAWCLDGIDEFDAGLFGFTPAAANQMDPQQRLFLHTVHHAIEDAGLDPWAVAPITGVFASTGTSTYLLNNLLDADPNASMAYGPAMSAVSLAFGNDKDYIATRVSHTFNFTGPSLSVQTACSSSLVAIHLACQSLLLGECDLAIAGGVSVRVPHAVGYFAEPGSILSASGVCRPFDTHADGTVFGSGLGAVVLKPLLTALADGDRIRAIIRGSAVNNDGNRKMGFSAPSVGMQGQVIADALAVAGVDPGDIELIEAHGTGTVLGDPVEVKALARSFSGSERPCVLHSIKANVGHLEAAAGVASFQAAVLATERARRPGMCHFEQPNPELDLDRTPFVLTAETSSWDSPLRFAGVSSLGVGGTNAHIVVQSAPAPAAAETLRAPTPAVIRLSAATPEALTQEREELAIWVDRDEADLADLVTTLRRRHTSLPYRCAVPASSMATAASALRQPVHARQRLRSQDGSPPKVAFLFSGQGSQYPAMASGLASTDPTFATRLDAVFSVSSEVYGRDLAQVLRKADHEEIQRTDLAQPLLFAVQLALSDYLTDHGLRPQAVLGHSIGEFAAAVAAGVMDQTTAVRLVTARGRAMAQCPGGAMTSFRGPMATIMESAAQAGLDIAAINSPVDVVVSGDEAELADLEATLGRAGVTGRPLHTANAFHSVFMEPAAEKFLDFARGAELAPPRIPMACNVSGGWLTQVEACDPGRWSRQIRSTVRFKDNLGLLLGDDAWILVEVGPGRSLTAAARAHEGWSDRFATVLTLGSPSRPDHEPQAIAQCLGDCWAAGADGVTSDAAQGRVISVPNYPFARTTFWQSARRAPGTRRESFPANPDPAAPVAPGTVGETVQRVIEDALGLTGVSAEDDFFALGGDSVVAIQVASEMSARGWPMTPQDLFEARTVSALVARISAGVLALEFADSDHVTAELTPTQWRLLREGGQPWLQWRVPLLLRSTTRVKCQDLAHALKLILARHDALRQSVDTDDPPIVVIARESVAPAVADHDAASVAEAETLLLERLAAPAASVMEVHLWPHAGTTGSLIGILLAHAVVDDASQALLLSDLRRALAGDALEPPAPTSWAEWTHLATRLAGHPAIVRDLGRWTKVVERADPRGRFPRERAPRAIAHHRVQAIDAATAQQLVEQAREQGRPLELSLVDALGAAIRESTGASNALVDVAGTMRAAHLAGVSLARTVGWFSTVQPVLSEPGIPAVLGPNEGFGFDAGRFVNIACSQVLGEANSADILLHYQVADLATDRGEQLQVVRSERLAAAASLGLGLGHAIQVQIASDREAFIGRWWADPSAVSEEDLDRLSAAFEAALRDQAVVGVSDHGAEADLLQELGMGVARK